MRGHTAPPLIADPVLSHAGVAHGGAIFVAGGCTVELVGNRFYNNSVLPSMVGMHGIVGGRGKALQQCSAALSGLAHRIPYVL